MSLEKPYLDIPGTIIFDAEQSRKGYWLNQFCMSLMKADNRERFKADERAYLEEWPMTEEQKLSVLARDLNRAMRTGGNIYFLAKLGATDHHGAVFGLGHTGHGAGHLLKAQPVGGGRSVQGNRYIGEDGDAQDQNQPQGKH
jgi:protocatechuate 4,5-dioxygenase alpha chain